jgi:hypothetical protein
MTVRVVIVPTGGGQTVTGARATVELDDRSVTVAADPVVVTLVGSLDRRGSSSGSLELTHSAPTGTQSGDRMFLTWLVRSLDGAFGADGTSTPDPAWTLVDRYSYLDAGYASRSQANLYTKVADADDQAGTSSYSWQAGGTFSYGSLFCTTFTGGGGWTLSSPVKTSGYGNATNLSLSAPAASQVLTFAVTRARVTIDGEVDIALDGGMLARSLYVNNVQGRHEHGEAASGATVSATVSGTNTGRRYQALFAVGVS